MTEYNSIIGHGCNLRPDAIDRNNFIVRELKPDTRSGIRRGRRQLKKYLQELKRITGEDWTGYLDTYKP